MKCGEFNWSHGVVGNVFRNPGTDGLRDYEAEYGAADEKNS